ncbi:glycoside hydrolase family 3 C-terminal domain-containing protein [Bacteroides sp.]
MKTKLYTLFALSCLGLTSLSAQLLPLPTGERFPVDSLISRMTLEEKIGQMMNDAPAIERLGIPQYNWWNECLHGVARAGRATVYPQAIALAATFDDAALLRSATIISDEARAKHHEAARRGERGIYQGLTYWSPNINIFRDPRWGRGQETYGEDPYLTSRMGLAFVRGLQGDDPRYLKLVATAKHFSVHSGPEYERHVFDVSPTRYDLADTYLPAFRTLVQQGKVASVMCAYNRLDGEPCCGSNALQVELLRERWGFKGYIVSDCGAIDDFYKYHKTYPDAQTASAKAVRAGTDLECGNSYQAIKEAIAEGRLTEEDLDVSLRRLFLARMKLGLFAPEGDNPYAAIPYSVVDSESHRQDALSMARKSIVLLKNENNTLPLSKQLRKIALVGPAVNDSVSLLGNYNGTPGTLTTLLEGIRRKVGPAVEVVYEKGVNLTDDRMFYPVDIWQYLYNGTRQGVKAEYFSNIKLEGDPVLVRYENRVGFRGGVNDEIAPGIKAAWMSARWTGDFIPQESQTFTIRVAGDDGFRLFVNGEKVVDHFSFHEEMADTYTFDVEKGKRVALCLEYFQGDQGASISMEGGYLKSTDYEQVAARVADADVILFAGGISPRLEGEEMPVNLPGFYKGDRTTIRLPEVQTRMMQALHRTGKPVVFVMQTGSALAVAWEAEHLPAIVNTWYGGQAMGDAVADVLFGDYNPAGRLPVTFYRSDDDLPPYEDYSMKGRTYRYFDGKALFPFGFGLSYSTFGYSNLRLPAHIKKGQSLEVEVDVCNTGARDGEEVAQVYVTHQQGTGYTVPRCALKGFQRVFLKKGESRRLRFTLPAESLEIISEGGTGSQIAETITVFVGGGQPLQKETKAGVSKRVAVK